jgi:ABC-2 type transport system permease protein
VALLYGMVNVAFALGEGIGRGFDVFPNLVKSGDFDRLLLRPRSTALQVAGQELQLMRLGRLAQGLMVLVWAATALEVGWTFGKVALIAGAVAGGACLFYGLFVLQATAAFWTVEGLELANAVTYGGTETAQYPLSVYRPWFRRFFTWVVPLACTTYFPAQAILGREASLLHWLAPAVGVLFLIGALQVWRWGVRHYCSTGS